MRARRGNRDGVLYAENAVARFRCDIAVTAHSPDSGKLRENRKKKALYADKLTWH